MGAFQAGKHKIQVEYSPTGTFSPWHLKAALENGIALWTTSDVGYFVCIDEEKIYRVNSRNTYQFIKNYGDRLSKAYEQSENEGDKVLNEFISEMEEQESVEEFLNRYKKNKQFGTVIASLTEETNKIKKNKYEKTPEIQ